MRAVLVAGGTNRVDEWADAVYAKMTDDSWQILTTLPMDAGEYGRYTQSAATSA